MCEAIKEIRNDAKAEGKAEERLKIEKNLRKLGLTEEQIQQALNTEPTDS